MEKQKDESYSHKKGYGSYHSMGYAGAKYKRGVYMSNKGIVQIYAEKARPHESKWKSIISLSFVYNERIYYRTLRKVTTISDQALSRRASKFVKDIINES